MSNARLITDGYPYSSFKNKIINGNFLIAQRGASAAVTAGSTGYTLDQWALTAAAQGSESLQSIASSELPFSSTLGRWTKGANSTGGTSTLRQIIEDVTTLNNQTVTLSFMARASAALTLGLSLQQYFGSGGSASVTPLSTSLNLTTSFQRFSFTFQMPSTAGKTIAAIGYLALALTGPAAAFTVDLGEVQLEAGEVATDFDQRHRTQELSLCQRYACTINATLRFTPSASGQYVSTALTFPQIMRAMPTAGFLAAGATANSNSYLGNVTTTGARFEMYSGGSGDSYVLDRVYLFSAEIL